MCTVGSGGADAGTSVRTWMRLVPDLERGGVVVQHSQRSHPPSLLWIRYQLDPVRCRGEVSPRGHRGPRIIGMSAVRLIVNKPLPPSKRTQAEGRDRRRLTPRSRHRRSGRRRSIQRPSGTVAFIQLFAHSTSRPSTHPPSLRVEYHSTIRSLEWIITQPVFPKIMSHAFPLPAVPMKPRPPMSQRPTARYSYQTATTGMSSPTLSGESFWGGVSRGIKEKGGMDGVEEGNESVRTVMTTPNTSPHKLEQETVQESEVTPATSTSSPPPTMTTDFRALRVQHFERLSHSTNKEATNIDDLPVSVTHLDLSSPVIPPRLRKRSAISTDISTAPSSPPYNSLQRGVPSPSVGVLAGSNIVLDRINRLRDVASPSMSSGKRSSPSRRVSGTHSRKSSLGDRAELTPSSSNNTTTTSTTPRRIRPPRLDTIITPKPPSPTLQRVETTSSAKKMIGMFESLPNTPAGGARKALQDISEGRGGSIPSSTTLPYRRSYLAAKSLPPIDTTSNSLFPPVLQSTATERYEAPTLLSAWSPHGKMPIRDNGTTARPISIPNSPTTGMKSSPSKSMMSRSPLSKSPLREIIGAFAHVKAKMGNKKGNEEEDARGRVVKGRKRSETVSSWSGGVISRHGVGGAMAIDAGPVKVEIKPVSRGSSYPAHAPLTHITGRLSHQGRSANVPRPYTMLFPITMGCVGVW